VSGASERRDLLRGLHSLRGHSYLAQWRMQLAATLLASTTMSLAEIADQVGYGSETALSRAYKRSVGVAPAEWRRAKQRQAG
jgi:AraC-like DNA-binding protein